MSPRMVTVLKVTGWVLVAGVMVGASAAAMPRVKEWLKPGADKAELANKGDLGTTLVRDQPNTLQIPAEVNKSLGVQVAEVRKATRGRLLELSGSLAPDTDHLATVRSRFAGEVMEIEKVHAAEGTRPTEERPVRNGDQVEEGQLLAVVWSKDLGQQKSALVDAVSKLRLDQETLTRMEKLYREGAIPERSLREQERNLQADKITLSAAERTLRSWRLTDKEIQAIHAEADRIAERTSQGNKSLDKAQEKTWARVEVRAPIDGTIIEKNITRGAIIDTTTNLFMIADLRHLSVWANVYEEDLPALQALSRPIHWTIHLSNDPRKLLKGTINEIRPIIDPTQHAALAKGQVANPEGKLISGQFITAKVPLPPAADEAVIPTTALIEDGQESIVFVKKATEENSKEYQYTMRRVAVVRRGSEEVYVRSAGLLPKKEASDVEPLKPGEWVVTSGALEMKAALENLKDTATAKKP